jgi:acyl-lipid omega-6 desaturase (Delta-12 desaturase)
VTIVDPPGTTRPAPVTDPEPSQRGAADLTPDPTREGSLLPVIRQIPPEAYDNPTWRGLAYLGRDLAFYAAAVIGLLAFDHPLVVVPLWVLAGLSIAALFIVGHDAAHEALFRSRRLNSIVGHLAMLPSFHVYEGWVLGHNRIHHGYTVRQGFDFVWHPYTADEYRAMGRFRRLRHRIEWSWFGAGAYYTREVWWNKMIVGKPPARWARAIRRDRFIVLAFVVAAAMVLGAVGWADGGGVAGAAWTVLKVLILPFLAFQFIIGSVVHVHHIQPGIRWWPRREWNKFKGQMEGTTILRAPKGLNLFFHWIMVHVPHHVDMRIPMYRLELAAEHIKAAYPEVVHDEPLRFRDFIANTRRCKLYDFEQGRWMTYDEAAARLDTSTTDAP